MIPVFGARRSPGRCPAASRRYITSGSNGCCQRTPGKRPKSESLETRVQPCSTATAVVGTVGSLGYARE